VRPFELSQVCFDAQRPFAANTARFGTAVCTRRAGKTVGVAAKLLNVARLKAGCVALYITRSRINAKRIFWRILRQMNADYGLGGTPSESELSITLFNGSVIYLAGCVHEDEIENFRGLPIGIVVLDEAQSLPQWIERLVDEVLAPALMDFAGQLWLVGTPGPVPSGYFKSCVDNPAWAHESWTVFDNPWIQRKSRTPERPQGYTPEELLEDELRRTGKSREDPSIQREWFARWVTDTNSLVFAYDATRNHRTPGRRHQHYVIGVDLGFDDADALAVLGWSDDGPEVELVEEWVGTKQTPTDLFTRIKALEAKYSPQAIVCDTGGLGKKIVSEWQGRFSVGIEAAEKTRKLEHVELLNDALRTGRFFAPRDGRFAADCALVEWDKSNPESWKIGTQFHSDICDAVLYAYRRALHWLHVPETPAPKRGTPEALEAAALESQQQQDEYWDGVAAANLLKRQQEEEASAWL